jgi:hypothetical protein
LVKGDLFTLTLNQDNTQKLILQVDRVDDDRPIQPTQLGTRGESIHRGFLLTFSLTEISIDDSIKKTFSVDIFKMGSYTVQKIADKQVSILLRTKERFVCHFTLLLCRHLLFTWWKFK